MPSYWAATQEFEMIKSIGKFVRWRVQTMSEAQAGFFALGGAVLLVAACLV